MKIWTNKIEESWIMDRVISEWQNNNKEIITDDIKSADIIWISSYWVWKKIRKKHLKNKKVMCSIYHIDFESFDKKQEKDFYKLDSFVDEYHVISLKTKDQLKQLTDKKITSIPFWINQENWFYIEDKKSIRSSLGFDDDDYLIGSFQRDTEGKDLKTPKLIKGPDIFIQIAQKLNSNKDKLKVILTGTRRQYVIEQLERLGIQFVYYEMADVSLINKLYNILDLYLVTSRIEGGPQAILECATIRTPILSTDVGVANEILHKDSIIEPDNFESGVINIDYAYKKSKEFKIPEGIDKFVNMFSELHEN